MAVNIDSNSPIKTLHPKPEGAATKNVEALSLLNVSAVDFQKDIQKLPNIQSGNSNSAIWLQAISDGIEHIANGDIFRRRLGDPEADWSNRPVYDGKPITPNRLRHGDSSGVTSGEAAVLKVKARLGLGSIVPIPLWHTGGWITIKAPSNAAILELNRRIAAEKITLGRITNGMVFSNTTIYIQSYLMNFVLAHVYDTTFGTKDPEELKKIILTTDLPSMVWGMVCAMYPDGYDLREPCVAQITKCNHVSEGRVNIARLRVIDTSKLSEKQMKHMSKRNGAHTADELKAYQEEFDFQTRNVHIKGAEGFTMDMSVPSIAEYEQVGFNWVDSTVNMVDKAFRIPLKGSERDQYITDQGRLATLRQYSHWIGKLYITDGDEQDIIEDRDTIDTVCSEFSTDDTIRTSIMNSIGEYIEDTTIAIIGYPNTECPACGLRYGDSVKEGKDGEPDEIVRSEAVPEFIPLDMTTTFFTLCGQRIQATVTRPL